MLLIDDRPPWDRLDDETEEAYALLTAWLDHESDDLSAWIRDTLAHRRTEVLGLASRHRWRARRRARDLALAYQTREAAFDRQAALDEAWDALTHTALTSINEHIAKGSGLSVRDALAVLKAVQDHTRLAGGEATSRIDLGSFVPTHAAALAHAYAVLGDDDGE